MIVITANDGDRQLGRLLESSMLSVLRATTPIAAFFGSGPDLVFTSYGHFTQLICENAVMVVHGAAALPQAISCRNAVAIVNSADRALLELVAQRHLLALTSGLSASDTFTFSSLTSDSAVISLQRPITAFDGTVVEPFELPVAFSGRIEPFPLLACAAIFCLLGERNPLSGLAVWRLPGL